MSPPSTDLCCGHHPFTTVFVPPFSRTRPHLKPPPRRTPTAATAATRSLLRPLAPSLLRPFPASEGQRHHCLPFCPIPVAIGCRRLPGAGLRFPRFQEPSQQPRRRAECAWSRTRGCSPDYGSSSENAWRQETKGVIPSGIRDLAGLGAACIAIHEECVNRKQEIGFLK